MRKWMKNHPYIWVFSYALVYLPWFHYLEEHTSGKYFIMHTNLDDRIPFNEWFVIPYLLWFVYVGVVFFLFFFRDREEFYRYSFFLICGMTASLMICTIFPNGTDLRVPVDPDRNIACWLVNVVQWLDTPTNVFPSIHVYNAIGTHIAITHCRLLQGKRNLYRLSAILMILICMSTVVLKQHSVLDVAGAVLLAFVTYGWIYRKKTEESSWQRAMAGL